MADSVPYANTIKFSNSHIIKITVIPWGIAYGVVILAQRFAVTSILCNTLLCVGFYILEYNQESERFALYRFFYTKYKNHFEIYGHAITYGIWFGWLSYSLLVFSFRVYARFC